MSGISLKKLMIEALELRISPRKAKSRLELPSIGDPGGPKVASPTREQIDEAMFG